MAVTAFIRTPQARAAHKRHHAMKRGAPNKPKTFWDVRPLGKGIMFLPTCTLGFSSFITPDSFGDDSKPKFKGNAHFTQVQAEALADKLQKEVIDPSFEKLCQETGKKLKPKTAAVWLEESLKEPKEKSRIQLPYLAIACNAFLKTRDGEEVKQTIKAWDSKGALLDLPSLHLGMNSIVQFGVSPALWYGSLAKGYALPSLRLIGVRVLKLEQFGAGGDGSVGAVSEDELVGVEEGFEAEDLGAFLRGEAKPTPKHTTEELDTGITTDGPEEF